MHTSGGRVSVTINGQNYSARGIITIAPSNATAQSGVNQDGSVYRTVAPKARTAEITFDRFVSANGEQLIWDERVLTAVNFGATFIEQDTGRTHLISGAFFVGDPQMDMSTGEVSGLSIAGDAYKNIPS
jgi:hypothetical protein